MNANRKLRKGAITAACILGVMAAKGSPNVTYAAPADDIVTESTVIDETAQADCGSEYAADLTTAADDSSALTSEVNTGDTTDSDTCDNADTLMDEAAVTDEAEQVDVPANEATTTDEAVQDSTTATPEAMQTDALPAATATADKKEATTVITQEKAAEHPYVASFINTYNGINYSAVYDYNSYVNRYQDIWNAYGTDTLSVLIHFITFGMWEHRMGNDSFNVDSYYNTYQDLRVAFRANIPEYYYHYIIYGQNEGRRTNGVTTLQNPVTTYNGVNYSAVYNYNYYRANYGDLRNAFGIDDSAYIQHFVQFGMNERRNASSSFNMTSYKWRYSDLRRAFGSDNAAYYNHYITYGQREHRNAAGSQATMAGAMSSYDYYDFSSVYDFNYYYNRYADLRRAFGDDDYQMFMHFLRYGLNERRSAKARYGTSEYNTLRAVGPSLIDPVRSLNGIDFSSIYDYGYYAKNNPDVVKAFGYNSAAIFDHFVRYGMYEHRKGTPKYSLSAYTHIKNLCIQAAVNEAVSYQGYPYVWGGANPATSFDCSGLVNYCFNKYGIVLPRTAQQQYDSTGHIGWDLAAWGDLVFFTGTYNAGRYITHVEIYLGNDTSFGASTGGAQYHSVSNDPHLKGHFVCFGRIRRV